MVISVVRIKNQLEGVTKSLWQAWQHRWVKLGFAASTLIVIGSITPAYLPQNSPFWKYVRAAHLDGVPGKIGGTLLVLGGLALLTQAWLEMRLVVYRGVKHWSILCWWALPLIFAPPVFSHDAYSYAAQGWLAHNGLNPYDVGPGVLPGTFADQAPWVWRFTPTPYGPLAIRVAQGLVELCGNQPYLSAVAQRIPALVGVAMIVWAVPRIAQRMGVNAAFATWFAVLNPILVMDYIGGAHNDALMVGLTLMGIWLSFQQQAILGAAVIGVAAAVKQPAFLAAYAVAFIDHPWLSWRWPDLWRAAWRAFCTCITAIGTFVLISVLCQLGFGWSHAVNVPGMVVTISPFTVLGQGLQQLLNLFHLDASGRLAIWLTRAAGMAVSGGIIGWLALTKVRRQPITFLSWSYLAVALCGPALHGWYMLWGGVLLPHTRPSQKVVRAAVWTSVALLSYAAINLAWRNGATALGIAAIAPLAWQVMHHHQKSLDAPEENND
ncbi:MAG: polyprenol phosphomannose-dependent alpha 1,6 mannosyltransferase MptB [Propionibacteriaceae bacterium]